MVKSFFMIALAIAVGLTVGKTLSGMFAQAKAAA